MQEQNNRWPIISLALSVALLWCSFSPTLAMADSTGGTKAKFGTGHLEPGDAPGTVQRIHRVVSQRLERENKALADIAADMPGIESWALPHDEVLMRISGGSGPDKYVLVTRESHGEGVARTGLETVTAKIGERMIGFGKPVQATRRVEQLNAIEAAVTRGRIAEAEGLSDKLSGKTLTDSHFDWLESVVSAAHQKARRVRHTSDAKRLADMSQALALRRAAAHGTAKSYRHIPADAAEFWVPREWASIALLPTSRLVPGTPLGSTKKFHAILVEKAGAAKSTTDTVNIDGVQYVRRRVAKLATGTAVAVGVATYILLKGASDSELCETATNGEQPCE